MDMWEGESADCRGPGAQAGARTDAPAADSAADRPRTGRGSGVAGIRAGARSVTGTTKLPMRNGKPLATPSQWRRPREVPRPAAPPVRGRSDGTNAEPAAGATPRATGTAARPTAPTPRASGTAGRPTAPTPPFTPTAATLASAARRPGGTGTAGPATDENPTEKDTGVAATAEASREGANNGGGPVKIEKSKTGV